MNNIKNFGVEIGKAIIAERKNNGPYKTIEEFLERVTHKNLNKKSLEALIMCGAMDSFGDRNKLAHNIENLLSFHKNITAHNQNQHTSLFDTLDSKPQSILILNDAPNATLPQKLAWEKELLGFYVSGHPLDVHSEQLKRSGTTIRALSAKAKSAPKAMNKFRNNKDNSILVAHIDTAKIIMTKSSNKKMAFLTIQDKTGAIEAVVFPETFTKIGSLIKEGSVAAFECYASERDGKISIMIENMKVL
jgi:DNA polymerase-3 subunit alpha